MVDASRMLALLSINVIWRRYSFDSEMPKSLFTFKLALEYRNYDLDYDPICARPVDATDCGTVSVVSEAREIGIFNGSEE